ncbi:major facilitator superfamily domain-containing protein 4B-like [Oppia nitens]|uniref:major facilitator superfamily domain-containing protein 4B-like n=1 Tax=Oppia nitens TaxID=1686743 RepID=UPI0023DAFECF|nr:major facilitator superfamily domain-containing protein 4B-like [Oppia nitens]
MLLVNRVNYLYTILLLMIHMAFALCVSMFGPAFVDLKYILNTTIQNVSYIPTLLSIGNVIGTLVGMSYNYLNRQLVVVGLLVLMALSSTCIPFTDSLMQLYSCALVFGIGTGAWIAAYNVWLIEIWQHNAGQVLFISQLMYGTGAVLGPLLDRPYLTGDTNRSVVLDDKDRDVESLFLQSNSSTISVWERRVKLEKPFLMSGGILIVFPLIMLLMFVCKRYRLPHLDRCQYSPLSDNPDLLMPANNDDDDDNDNGNGGHTSDIHQPNNNRLPKIRTVILLSICLSSINSLELVYFNFGSTYFQYIPVRLTAPMAASMVSIMSAAYTIGQVVNFGMAFLFKTEHMITFNFMLSFITITGLTFGQNIPQLLWIVSASIGYSVSVLFPAILGFFGKYLQITDRIATLVFIMCGVVNFLPPLILGKYIESFPSIFIIIELILLFIAFISFITFLLMRYRYLR